MLHHYMIDRFQKSLKHKTDEFNFGSRYYADENNYLREYNRNFTIKVGFIIPVKNAPLHMVYSGTKFETFHSLKI